MTIDSSTASVVVTGIPPQQQQPIDSFLTTSTRQTVGGPSTTVAIDIPSNDSKRASFSDNNFDRNLLNRSIADVGRWAYGTLLVEVWVMEKNILCRKGWWIDPVYRQHFADDSLLCRLTEPSREDYIEPHPLAPGEGLPGALWAEASQRWTSSFRRSLLRDRQTLRQYYPDISPSSSVVWRDIRALQNDPDQPWNERLQALGDLGLGWAAAVPFEKGIVIYMARSSVDQTKLRGQENETYLVAASDLVGAAYCLRGPRALAMQSRRSETDAAFRRIRIKILALCRLLISLKDFVDSNHENSIRITLTETKLNSSVGRRRWQLDIAGFLKNTLQKAQGGNVKPPPTFTVLQAIHAWIGSFVTLLCVCRLSVFFQNEWGVPIVLGPFGALATLLYGLSAAPASQPRNVILGQLLSLSISTGISRFDGLEIWMRQALATSLSVSAMSKLGVTHPPAGAAALIWASGSFRWAHVGTLLLGNLVAIGTATFINNVSDQRQYPTYWGIGFLLPNKGKTG